MEFWIGFKFLYSFKIVINLSSANSELGVELKMFETIFKIIPRQSQVPVELHDEIPIIALDRMVAVVECFHHSAARLAEPSVPSVHDADPWQQSGAVIENFARPVGGTVVHDYPLRWRDRLRGDTSDRFFDVFLFITYRSDDYIFNVLNHDFDCCNALVARMVCVRYPTCLYNTLPAAARKLSGTCAKRYLTMGACVAVLAI